MFVSGFFGLPIGYKPFSSTQEVAQVLKSALLHCSLLSVFVQGCRHCYIRHKYCVRIVRGDDKNRRLGLFSRFRRFASVASVGVQTAGATWLQTYLNKRVTCKECFSNCTWRAMERKVMGVTFRDRKRVSWIMERTF